MSIEQWLPILTALVAVIGAAAVYSHQKRADRKHDLVVKRRAAYEIYLFSYLHSSDDFGTPDTSRFLQLNASRMNVLLLGSDEVLEAVAQLDDYAVKTSLGASAQRDGKEFTRLLSSVILAMRKDCFEKTETTIEDMQNALPIK